MIQIPLWTFVATKKILQSNLHGLLKEGLIVQITNILKPLLTEAHKLECIWFALSMLKEKVTTFYDLEDVVHLDEKHFS